MPDKLYQQMKEAIVGGDGCLCPIGRWGRFPTFQAKIGTGPSAVIIVKRVRKFFPKMHIQYCNIRDLDGMCVGCTPWWHGGYITKVEDNRIYLDMM